MISGIIRRGTVHANKIEILLQISYNTLQITNYVKCRVSKSILIIFFNPKKF